MSVTCEEGGAELKAKMATVMVTGIGVLLAGCSSAAPPSTTGTTGSTASTIGGVAGTAVFSVRPVLCAAPDYAGAAGQSPPAGVLPACAAASQLSVLNLVVTPSSSNPDGYTSNTSIPPDAQFAAYPSTTPANDTATATVLLPAAPPTPAAGRFVLGPAGLTGASVQSASAQVGNGGWLVNITLTSAGTAAWNELARTQFHAFVAVDVNAQVVSEQLIQPTALYFTTVSGQVTVAGFTESEARTVVSEITAAR